VCPLSSTATSIPTSAHNLSRYAAEAGIPVQHDQQREDQHREPLLVQLQDVPQAGKYPVAKRPGGSPSAWGVFDNPADIAAVKQLLQQLDDFLRSTGAQGLMERFDVAKLEYGPNKID
jgi:hypothetical protein